MLPREVQSRGHLPIVERPPRRTNFAAPGKVSFWPTVAAQVGGEKEAEPEVQIPLQQPCTRAYAKSAARSLGLHRCLNLKRAPRFRKGFEADRLRVRVFFPEQSAPDAEILNGIPKAARSA